MKKIYIMSALAVCLFSATACSDFLDREPDKIMTDDQIFGDVVMIKSVLANYYGRVTIIRKTKNSSFKNEKSKKEVDVTITVSNKDIV